MNNYIRSVCAENLGNDLPNKIMKCLKQIKVTRYKGKVEKRKHNWRNKIASVLAVELPSDTKWVHEEYYIFDELGLLGFIGGSLGLFVGFSFYGYIVEILDILTSMFPFKQ